MLLGGCAQLPPLPATTPSPSPPPPAAGHGSERAGSPVALASTATASPPPPTPTPSPPPPPTATATALPTATVAPSPTATPDPFAPYYIETLAARSYGKGAIEIGAVQEQKAAFTRYAFSYPSDGLTVTGYLMVPNGEGPFPVVLLNHGYYHPNRYRQGNGTVYAAEYLARRGYLTVASDYRNYGGSEDGPYFFRVAYVVDVMNLLANLDSLPAKWADISRVGMWGHSMGGGITVNAAVLAGDQLDAVVVYGGMSGDMAANSRHVQAMWKREEFARPIGKWGGPDQWPEAYRRMSALHYMDRAQAAFSIHHGTHDEQVPYPWSETLRDVATGAGLQVEHYGYHRAPHSFRGEDWRQFMVRVAHFFDRHLREGTKEASQQQDG